MDKGEKQTLLKAALGVMLNLHTIQPGFFSHLELGNLNKNLEMEIRNMMKPCCIPYEKVS
jgi:hypothetical protein